MYIINKINRVLNVLLVAIFVSGAAFGVSKAMLSEANADEPENLNTDSGPVVSEPAETEAPEERDPATYVDDWDTVETTPTVTSSSNSNGSQTRQRLMDGSGSGSGNKYGQQSGDRGSSNCGGLGNGSGQRGSGSGSGQGQQTRTRTQLRDGSGSGMGQGMQKRGQSVGSSSSFGNGKRGSGGSQGMGQGQGSGSRGSSGGQAWVKVKEVDHVALVAVKAWARARVNAADPACAETKTAEAMATVVAAETVAATVDLGVPVMAVAEEEIARRVIVAGQTFRHF